MQAALIGAGEPVDLRTQMLRLRGMLRTNLGDLIGAERDLREALDLSVARHGARPPVRPRPAPEPSATAAPRQPPRPPGSGAYGAGQAWE